MMEVTLPHLCSSTLATIFTVFTGGPVTYYLIEVAGRRIEVGPDARSYVLTGLIPETNYG